MGLSGFFFSVRPYKALRTHPISNEAYDASQREPPEGQKKNPPPRTCNSYEGEGNAIHRKAFWFSTPKTSSVLCRVRRNKKSGEVGASPDVTICWRKKSQDLKL